MYNISLNDNLLRLVEGKRVAVIGPAPYLIGKNNGATIDKYDIIIRINSFSVPDNVTIDYGSRADIMFHNFGTPWMNLLKTKISDKPNKFSELKMLGCLAIKSTHSETNFMSWEDGYISDVVKNSDSINTNNVPFYWIGVKDYKKLHSIIGCEPYQGVLSLAVLIKYPIKELFVSGFTFYQGDTSFKSLYYDGYRNDNTRFNGAPHGKGSIEKSISFVKNLVQENDKVLNLDPEIKRIIKI
jgi:hypothetical protein